MQYVLGIDSGGTKYLVKACDLNGKELASYTGVPAGHYRFSREEALRRIDENLDACLLQFKASRADCVSLVCGTTGVDSEADRAYVTQLYGALSGFSCPMLCVNDAQVAHFAVTGGVGAVVIAGTGSIAYGCNEKGETTRSGGWPPVIFGDEGSGTWLTCRALHRLSLEMDGRASASRLGAAVAQALGITDGKQLIEACIAIEQQRFQNPGIAAMIDTAAEQQDEAALQILREAAQHTFALANSVVSKLKLFEQPRFCVGAWGSAIVKSPLHFALFKEKFEQAYENVDVCIAQEDAATGACRMALKRLQTAP